MAFMNERALRRTLLVLASAALLAACGSGSQDTGNSGGKTVSGAGELQDAALPLGLAKMPGAKVTSTDVPSGDSKGDFTSKMNLEVAASSADVAKFYTAEFGRLGIPVENNMVMQGNMILSGKAPNGEDIVINAEDGVGGAPTRMTVATAKVAD